ncbi:MobA/MobL family protein, partial [Psychrobacter sp. 1Y7]|uniref:MobA/MobL family protein n=1 Tax=Psychrobacter sp. 1Y7 TaxID=3457442 RepID=UPI003FCF8034
RAEVKPISRSKGHNAVAAAAYRAGEKLTDKNKYNPNAMVHDYSKKSDIMHKNIILPAVLAEQDFKIDRENLWSMVEEHEVTKKDKTLKSSARVAREWLLALPHELSDSENIALAEEFATKMANDLGVIADCCIHNPKLKSNVPAPKPSSKAADNTTDDDDERNIHAHIMFTTRKAELNTANQLIFTDKADSELDGTARKAKGLVKETEYIKTVRAEWAEMINKRLLEHGIKAVSSLSYKDRKLDVLPQVHIGRSPLSDRKREHNDEISERNESVFNSRAATVKRFADRANGQSATTDRYLKRASRTIGYNERVTSHLDKGIKYSKQRVEYSERLIEKRASKASNPFSDAIRRSSAARESAAVSYNRETEAFDRTTDETTSKLQKYSGLGNKWVGQRKFVVARYAREAELLNRRLLHKITKRKDSNNRIKWESYESVDDPMHSQKFDKRQQEILEAFAIEYNLDRNFHEDHADFDQYHKNLANDLSFFRNNADIFEIVRDPEKERERHNAKTLSDNRQEVLNVDIYNSTKEQSNGLQKDRNESRIANSSPIPRF